MIGCVLLGAAGVFAVARLIHHRRHFGYGGYGGGCHGGGGFGRHQARHWGGFDGGGGPFWDGDDVELGSHGPWGRRFGRGFIMRAVADRLDASPAQERVIRDAFEELQQSASKLRSEGRQTRADVAGAFRKGHFDAVLFGELFARHDTALEELRKAFVGAGAKIHDALDDKQRARLADLIEAGPRAWRGGWRRHGAGMSPGSW